MRHLPLLLAATLIAACCSTDEGLATDNTARRIVHEHTSTHFEVELDPTDDKAALEEFVARTKDAKTRSELATAWAAVPSLKAKGKILANVFKDAEQDGSWPATANDGDYVGGVHDAINEFLGGGG